CNSRRFISCSLQPGTTVRESGYALKTYVLRITLSPSPRCLNCLPCSGCPTPRALCDEWDFAADGWARLQPFFITNARSTHHRNPTGSARQYSLICRSRGAPTRCANPNQGHPGCARRNRQYYLITILEAIGGPQQAAENPDFSRIKRRIELSPYSGIF